MGILIVSLKWGFSVTKLGADTSGGFPETDRDVAIDVLRMGGQRLMRRDNSAWISLDLWVLAVLGATILAVYPAGARSDGVELVVDRSPTNGGTVAPEAGVHRFDANAEVTITAIPQEGYRFAYWLGDVTDSTASTTRIRLAGSKAVVAVFEQVQADLLDERDKDLIVAAPAGGGGGGGLVYTAHDFWMGGPISPGGGRARPGRTIVVEFPPAPVPEPATFALMGLGAAILRRAQKRLTQTA